MSADCPDDDARWYYAQLGRLAGIETVFQTLAVAPALDIASNLYLGREIRDKGPLGKIFRMLDTRGLRAAAKEQLKDLGIGTIQDPSQTAALGVRESGQVLALVSACAAGACPSS